MAKKVRVKREVKAAADDARTQLLQQRRVSPIKGSEILSSGLTLLNLASTGRPSVCFPKGGYYLFVGDSASGKTFLALTTLAEAARNPAFARYRLIYDAPERGAKMSIAAFFGDKLARRLEVLCSNTIEEFYYNLDDALEQGPCIYIEDSFDALTSDSEVDKFKEHKEAHRKGKTAPGSFGDGKAKKNSSGIRQNLHPLAKTGSILIGIAQTRDNLGFGFKDKTRSGGRALTFYADFEVWTSLKGQIKKTVNGKERVVGDIIRLKVEKNRMTGNRLTVDVPFYPSHGFDDTGSVVNFLIEEKYWAKGDTTNAPEFNFTGPIEKLITKIETEGRDKELQALAVGVWQKLQLAMAVDRRPRYV